MKIFLDVGAHHGQTLAAVRGLFDEVHCFEPVSECWPFLSQIADNHTKVHKFGLWNRTAKVDLIDPGSKGASMWLKDNRRPGMRITRESCNFRRASDWFRDNISSGDRVYLKLNCEGCECDILDDLLDSGEFDKVSFAMIDFDVRKISALKHRQQEVWERLQPFQSRVMTSKTAMVGNTHKDRIRHWLGMTA